MTFTTWTTNDDHTGGMVGMFIGVGFLIIGFIYVFLKERHMSLIPMHRILLGGVLVVLGFLALITGMVFVIK